MIRIWNNDVTENLDAVLRALLSELEKWPLTPPLVSGRALPAFTMPGGTSMPGSRTVASLAVHMALWIGLHCASIQQVV